MKLDKDHIALFFLSAVLFIPFLGNVHLFDWDEINFAESAREMLVTGNWWSVRINFEPFWEKPPLFFWFQALSMKVFGINEFASRLPNAICGIITLKVIYEIGKRWQNRKFAWIWVMLYAGSFLPHLYFKSGIIDPWFNLFIFLSVFSLFVGLEHNEKKTLRPFILAGLFSGLGILTKGPVALLLLLLTFAVWLILTRFKKSPSIKAIISFSGILILVSSLWFGYETIQNGPWFIKEFVLYQIDLLLSPVAGHKQPFFYHFLVVLIGCFPLSVIAISSFHRRFVGDEHRLSLWMKVLFWVVIILFSLVTTKIVHYSSMTYLPLSYLAGLVIYKRIKEDRPLVNWQRIWLAVQGSIIAIALALVPLLLIFKAEWVGLINDPFVVGNLEAMTSPIGWEWMIGLLYLAVIWYSFVQLKQNVFKGLVILTLGTSITIFSTMTSLVPIIESASQRSAIAFFEEHSHEDAHKFTFGYKSYAQYFYGGVTPSTAWTLSDKEFSDATKPCYISVKSNRISDFEALYPKAQLLSAKGGFQFYRID